jgi:ribonucleoside-diphosphate reductase alpha chain
MSINFNISIAITNEFMEKVIKDEEYNLIDPKTKEVRGHLNAKEVFDLIASCAHKNGEPGLIFIDKMNQFNPTPEVGLYEATNRQQLRCLCGTFNREPARNRRAD